MWSEWLNTPVLEVGPGNPYKTSLLSFYKYSFSYVKYTLRWCTITFVTHGPHPFLINKQTVERISWYKLIWIFRKNSTPPNYKFLGFFRKNGKRKKISLFQILLICLLKRWLKDIGVIMHILKIIFEQLQIIGRIKMIVAFWWKENRPVFTLHCVLLTINKNPFRGISIYNFSWEKKDYINIRNLFIFLLQYLFLCK